MRGPNTFLSTLATSNDTATADDLPAALLESLIPGFGFIRRLLLASLGFDVTFLVSGVLVLVGALSAGKYVYGALSSFAERYLMSSVTIEPNNELYTQIMLWVSKHVVTDRSRSLTARPNNDFKGDFAELAAQLAPDSGDATSQSSTIFDFNVLQAELPVLYQPYYGDHSFWHGGRWFLLRREKRDVTMIGYNSTSAEVVETISIKTFGFSPKPIKALLQLCKKEDAERNRTLTTINRPHRRMDHWHAVASRPSRPFDTVYLDQADKDALLNDAMEFLHPLSHRFYASRGIPYRRGYLLYGPAGTGKTTISMTLAGYFGLDLCVLSLVEASMTDERLGSLFAQLPSRCIILLEDIDAAGLEKREELDKQAKTKKAAEDKDGKAEKASEAAPAETPAPTKVGRRGRRNPETGENQPGVTLSGLLNALDGVASQEGRILIMTTNDPEALDKALIRPGRVDMQVYFGYLSKANAKQMFKRMYQDDDMIARAAHRAEKSDETKHIRSDSALANGLLQQEKSTEDKHQKLNVMADRFADMLPDVTFTPAEVQGFLLSRRKSPEKALDELEKWRDELLKAKATGRNIIASAAAQEMKVDA